MAASSANIDNRIRDNIIVRENPISISQARYAVSGNKRKVHIRSREVADLTVVENVFRKMLDGIDSHVFEISHAARSVLKLNNVGKFRSLCDHNLEVRFSNHKPTSVFFRVTNFFERKIQICKLM